MATQLSRHVALVAFSITSALACQAHQRPQATDDGSVRALVRRGAWLRVQPQRTAPGARDGLLSDRPYRVGRAFTVEVLSQTGPWLRVSTRPKDEQTRPSCARPLWAFRHLALQVYVHVDDLVPALSKDVIVEHPDGTSVRLVAGTPVWPVPNDSRYRVRTRRYRFPAHIPEDVVNVQWRYSGHFEPAQTDTVLRDSANARLLGRSELVNTLRWTPNYLLGEAKHPRGRLVTVGDQCARLKIIVQADAVRARQPAAPPSVSHGPLRGSQGVRDGLVLPQGTALTWRDGSPAGHVTSSFRVNPLNLLAGESSRLCWRVWIRALRRPRTSTASDSLVVCADRPGS